MVQSKTELFEKDLAEKAELFKALSHPARLRILQFLAETNSSYAGDISDALPLGRTTVNQHLSELKNVGLIKFQTEGIKTRYFIDTAKINEMGTTLQSFLENVNPESVVKLPTNDYLQQLLKVYQKKLH